MSRRLSDRDLRLIKDFASKNMFLDEDKQLSINVTIKEEDVALTNPWMDRSARFELDDAGEVKEWGLLNVLNYIEYIANYLSL